MFTELISGYKKDTNEEQWQGIKEHKISIEAILNLGILLVAIIVVMIIFLVAIIKENVIVIWFLRIAGLVYFYWAIKQILKMVFVLEDRAFLKSDIRDFIFSYLIWVLLMFLLRETIINIIVTDIYIEPYKGIVRTIVMYLWLYFNVLFVLGGIYVLLYYSWSLLKKVGKKLIIFKGEKVALLKIKYSICSGDSENVRRMKCIEIWKKDRKFYIKILSSLPLFLYDAMCIILGFIKDSIILILLVLISIVLDAIFCITRFIRMVWNMHPNNEWMYIIAQASGLVSYIVLFVIIQYGDYGDAIRNTYEFFGTIVLIPYFLRKLLKTKK